MMLRRLPMIGVAAAALVATVLVGRSDPEPGTASFSATAAAMDWMPSVPATVGLSTTWFCPGVPATGEPGVGGEVVIANADAASIEATISVLGETPGVMATERLTVAPYAREVVDVAGLVTTPYASAVVEITGGTGVVEQIARQPIGQAEDVEASSAAACTTSTSSTWYLAEGFTAEGSVEELVLTNPGQTSAQVQIDLATQSGSRQPNELRSYTVPSESVRVLDMSQYAARDEPEVAVSVVANRGRVVVGRAQRYGGTNRRGYHVVLAAPELRDQWWFADGENGNGVSERYSIYNADDEPIEVTPVLLGRPAGEELVPLEALTVPANQVATFTPAEVDGMPEGRHSFVFGTANPEQRMVVERAITRTFENLPTTSVVMGAPPRPDGFVPSTWTMAVGVSEPTEDALVLYNPLQADARVSVRAIGPGGLVDVPGLTDVDLPAYALTSLDLSAKEVVGRQLIVSATSGVFVERLLPRAEGALGRVGSWPLPANI